LVAQSLDFNEYRRKLAAASPKSPVLSADRKASGTLQTKVEDKKQQSPNPDKLTLSKGSIQGKSPEAQIATQLAAKDSAERAAEIKKNISDLNKLSVTSNQAAPPPQGPVSAASAPSLDIAASPVASASSAVAPLPKSSAASAKKPSTDWFEGLIKNPYTPLGALALIAAMLGLGVFRYKQRNKNEGSILGELPEPEIHEDRPQAPTLTEHPVAFPSGPERSEVENSALDLDLDLALDLDLGAETAHEPLPKRAATAPLNESVDLDLPDLDIFAAPQVTSTPTKAADLQPKAPPTSSAPIAASTPDLNALDFELGLLSLDLGEASGQEQVPPMVDSQDPLETKLALAHEFSAIGDEHGARALIEEVIAEASGAMKTKAERALSQLQVS
jgi:FimV-like protein